MCPHFKPDKSEINTCINAKRGDTQNILPVVNVKIRRGNYSVSLICLTHSVSQTSYFYKEVLEHLKCDPKTVEDVAMDIVTFVGNSTADPGR